MNQFHKMTNVVETMVNPNGNPIVGEKVRTGLAPSGFVGAVKTLFGGANRQQQTSEFQDAGIGI